MQSIVPSPRKEKGKWGKTYVGLQQKALNSQHTWAPLLETKSNSYAASRFQPAHIAILIHQPYLGIVWDDRREGWLQMFAEQIDHPGAFPRSQFSFNVSYVGIRGLIQTAPTRVYIRTYWFVLFETKLPATDCIEDWLTGLPVIRFA